MPNEAACTAFLRRGLVFAASRSQEPGPTQRQDPGHQRVGGVVFSFHPQFEPP